MFKTFCIEIMDDSINILKCSNRKKIYIDWVKSIEISFGNIKDGKIINQEEIESAIDKNIDTKNKFFRKFIFILNSSLIISKKITLPHLVNKKQVKSMIENEIEHLISSNIDKYKIGYKLISIHELENLKYVDYLVYLVPDDIILEYVKLANKIGHSGITVTFDGVILDRLFENCMLDIDIKNEIGIVIRLEKNKIIFNGFKNKVCDFSKTLTNINTDNNTYEKEILKYLRYYFSIENTIENLCLKKIWLYGEYKICNEIHEMLNEYFEEKVDIINKFDTKDVISKYNFSITKYLNCLLSCFNSGNLYIDYKLNEKKIIYAKLKIRYLIMVSLFIVSICFLYNYLTSYRVNKEIDKKINIMKTFLENEENIKINNEVCEIKEKILSIENNQKQIDEINKIIKSKTNFEIKILKSIVEVKSNSNKIQFISYLDNHIEINCISENIYDLIVFLQNIKRNCDFDFLEYIYISNIKKENSNYICLIIINYKG